MTVVAAAATGFVLNQNVLIVSGMLVGASGTLLTLMMARAMGRSVGNVFFGAFGKLQVSEAGTAAAEGTVRSASAEDVGVMLAFGALGYAMKKLGYSPAALVLALVLGPLAERALRQSLIISDAGIGIFFMRPISAVLTVAALAAIVVPTVRGIRAAARRRAAAAAT